MTGKNRYVCITVKGLVQGIGFRPFVAEIAEKLNISGIVRNSGGIVIIYAYADDDSLNKFTRKIKEEPPAGAIVNSISIEDINEDGMKYAGYETKGPAFKIVDSNMHEDVVRLLPPDLPVCDNCIKELLDKNNRRYRYPFISCTSCGPRFSIMHTVPYDRENTTMDIFNMCPDCFEEYTKKGDIRRHAQTISCHRCGPQLSFTDKDSYLDALLKDNKDKEQSNAKDQSDAKDQNDVNNINNVNNINDARALDNANEKALLKATHCIKDGQIGAVLDIGGFHFAFSPYINEPSKRLRIWKNRESKPFAVMFPDIDSIKLYCYVSKREEELLKSNPRPIVLLKQKDIPDNESKFADEVLMGSDRIGAMLPCSPLQILLLKETGPLVMTSGNRGGEPIVTDPDIMSRYLGTGGPDFMLSHQRKILTPLDDSIYQVNGDVVQIIRRARGLVPWPVDLPFTLKEETFAAGGDLKAVFALGKADKAYLSAHFSDLDELEACKAREKAISHMEELLDVEPVRYVCDKHPGYISVKNTDKQAGGHENVLHVQHHLSHIMAVTAEHDIRGDFVGVAYDGTGFGDDGSIWGSEFFICNINDDLKCKETDCRHLSYYHGGSLLPVKMTGGDEGAKDAVKTLYCYLYEAKKRDYIKIEEIYIIDKYLRGLFEEGEYSQKHDIPDMKILNAALDHDINTVISSSMGRLFDAVSALLGICCYNSYEGECPAKLEIFASKAKKASKLDFQIIKAKKADSISGSEDIYYMDGVKLIADICRRIIDGEDKGELALGFHKALSLATVNMAETLIDNHNADNSLNETKYPNKVTSLKLAIGGGTFLNRLLNTNIQDICRQKSYMLYQNSLVPPGDGGIALGQLYLSQCRINE